MYPARLTNGYLTSIRFAFLFCFLKKVKIITDKKNFDQRSIYIGDRRVVKIINIKTLIYTNIRKTLKELDFLLSDSAPTALYIRFVYCAIYGSHIWWICTHLKAHEQPSFREYILNTHTSKISAYLENCSTYK